MVKAESMFSRRWNEFTDIVSRQHLEVGDPAYLAMATIFAACIVAEEMRVVVNE